MTFGRATPPLLRPLSLPSSTKCWVWCTIGDKCRQAWNIANKTTRTTSLSSAWLIQFVTLALALSLFITLSFPLPFANMCVCMYKMSPARNVFIYLIAIRQQGVGEGDWDICWNYAVVVVVVVVGWALRLISIGGTSRVIVLCCDFCFYNLLENLMNTHVGIPQTTPA